MDLPTDSFHSPTTAFLYSCLNIKELEASQNPHEDPRDNVFDRAFKISNLRNNNNAQQKGRQPSIHPWDFPMTPEGMDGEGFKFQSTMENQYEFPDSPPMSERHGTSQTPSASSNNSGKEVKSRKKYRERQPVSQQEKDRKRTAFLERNRVAAGKCRSRKKDLVGQLEQDVRKAQTLNTALKAEHLVLLGEVNALRALAATCDDECKAAKEPVKVEAPTRTET